MEAEPEREIVRREDAGGRQPEKRSTADTARSAAFFGRIILITPGLVISGLFYFYVEG
jgi:hypothetical protein